MFLIRSLHDICVNIIEKYLDYILNIVILNDEIILSPFLSDLIFELFQKKYKKCFFEKIFIFRKTKFRLRKIMLDLRNVDVKEKHKRIFSVLQDHTLHELGIKGLHRFGNTDLVKFINAENIKRLTITHYDGIIKNSEEPTVTMYLNIYGLYFKNLFCLNVSNSSFNNQNLLLLASQNNFLRELSISNTHINDLDVLSLFIKLKKLSCARLCLGITFSFSSVIEYIDLSRSHLKEKFFLIKFENLRFLDLSEIIGLKQRHIE